MFFYLLYSQFLQHGNRHWPAYHIRIPHEISANLQLGNTLVTIDIHAGFCLLELICLELTPKTICLFVDVPRLQDVIEPFVNRVCTLFEAALVENSHFLAKVLD